MSLQGILRQHVVEFISGATTGGIWTDGVRSTAQGTSGPYTWYVPDGVAQLTLDGCGAGQSGGAGAFQTSALSAGGGAGGCYGASAFGILVSVNPRAGLTITLGAGGAGTATSDGAANSGGSTTIAGLNAGIGVVSGTMTLRGGSNYIGNAPTSSTSAVDTNGQGNSTAGAQGAQGSFSVAFTAANYYPNGGAASGGGGKASAAAGANGGYYPFSYSTPINIFSVTWNPGGTGTTSGGVSMGGGGRGNPSFFSMVSPAGGGGDATGTDAAEADYGAGGGGGGGSGTARRRGGNGGNGYVRITYWSAD